MGKISTRLSKTRRRSNPTQHVYGRRDGGAVETRLIPSGLTSNTSAFDGSLVSVPAVCNNAVTGDVNIKCCVVVAERKKSVVSEDSSLSQETLNDSDQFTKTVLRSPKKFISHRRSARALRSGETSASRELNLRDIAGKQPRSLLKSGGVKVEKQPLVPIIVGGVKTEPLRHVQCSITGDIIGARVIAAYHCSICGNKLRPFKCQEFSVKCGECKHNWKCSQIKFTCTADITIARTDERQHGVTLCDSLLRSIVKFKSTGYCDKEQTEQKVLQVGRIKVDFEDGNLNRATGVTRLQDC
ncbi:uncharacterized protein LOC143512653 isoform X2 [Brachyhypopomus gauderio]|uniref:uncharacterized protein LOC143512653 isoform X2 n=1 Tax=Brachyhypopomus gauderio TaxID=698409 RepID=UPI0040421734